MRTMLMAVLVAMIPTAAAAQVNTTGSISPNTTGVVAQTPTTGGTTTGTTTGGTTGTTTGTTASPTTTPATGTTTAAGAPRDAAIVICGQDFSTGAARLLVFTASTNAGGPTIPPGTACAQALSDLFVAGFTILDVLPFNQQLQYTLVR